MRYGKGHAPPGPIFFSRGARAGLTRMGDPNTIQLGGTELPEVLRKLAGVLPQFEGDGLESQLQTYDIFLETLAASVRPQVAALLKGAAAQAKSPEARARIEAAAESVTQGGRAAAPYDHAQAMADYQKEFRKSFPNTPEPAPPPDPRGECDLVPKKEDELAATDDAKIKNTTTTAPITKPGEKRSHPQILAQLDRIQAEMRRIGYWSPNPPDLQAAVDRGEIKSFMDAPSFELWLQMIFLPHARQWTLEDSLPAESQIGELARRQYDYMSVAVEADELMHLLWDFDALIAQAAQGKA